MRVLACAVWVVEARFRPKTAWVTRRPPGAEQRRQDERLEQYTVIACGGTCMHIINGQLMAVMVDDDLASSNNQSGLFASRSKQPRKSPCATSG
jgi:hypothetical protein